MRRLKSEPLMSSPPILPPAPPAAAAAPLGRLAPLAPPAPTAPTTPAATQERLAGLLRLPQVLALVAASGTAESHVVGGTLRDAILGLAVHDLDVVVAGRGDEIARDLAASLPGRLVKLGGKEFAAYRLVCPDGTVVDLWDRAGASLRDDLERRDLTINSLALDARSGALADPFGGLADLRRQLLRATTDRSFTGDPLRVLRLARLVLRLPGFTAAPATLELARRAVPGLAEVAAERIREELWLVLSHEQAEQGLRVLADLGVYPALWLGLPPGSSGADRHVRNHATDHAVDLAAGEMAALADRARELEDWLTAAGTHAALDLVSARFAATCRYLKALEGSAGEGTLHPSPPSSQPPPSLDRSDAAAAPATHGPRRALAHLQAAGYVAARQVAAIEPLLPAANAGLPTVANLLATTSPAGIAGPPGTASPTATANLPAIAGPAGSEDDGNAEVLPGSEVERRRFLHRHGRRWLTVACSCGAAATVRGAAALDDWRHRAAPLCALAALAGETLMAPPRLLTGGDVQDLLGIAPGPRIGAALAALTAAQVDGEVGSREEAAAFLRAWRAR